MREISWDDNFNTGVEKIDAQHKCFIAIINELSHMSKCVNDDKLLNAKLDELVRYTEYHFSSEQYLMLELEYDGYSQHLVIHQSLITGLRERISGYRVKKKSIDDIIDYLFQWFVGHTIDDDRNIANWMGEKAAT